MASYTYADQITLTTMICGECGISFAIPETYRKARQENGGSWYCPNGHSRIYRESDVDRLTRERDAARVSREAARDQAAAAERRAAAARGQVTKIRKRVANGVCPCCHRTFANVARHMATKHPDEAGAS